MARSWSDRNDGLAGRRPAAVHMAVMALALGGLVAAAPARASHDSELLYSQGLAFFHAGQYTQALPLFDQAVAADPNDAYARYYRGVTHGRLEQWPAAVTDLRAAAAAKPDLEQVPLELGIALVQNGEYADAVSWLQRAQARPRLDADASLFLGIAQLRLGQPAAGRENLARAAARNPALTVQSRYYLGVSEVQTGDSDAARQDFQYVASASPDSTLGRAASRFLERLGTGAAALAAARPYVVYGAVGYQYDDNVQLLTDVKVPGASGRADGRVTLEAGAAYVPRWRYPVRAALGYEFFQSLQFHMTDYNLQNHRASLQLETDAGPVQVGTLGLYDFFFRGTDTYLSQGTVMPWLSYPEGTFGRSEVYFRLRARDYLANPENDILDGNNYSPGIRQFVYLGAVDRAVFAGYRYDYEDPYHNSGDPYGYNGNEVSAGGSATLPWAVQTDLTYAYRHEDYFGASDGRRDEEHQLAFGASKQLAEYVTLRLGYLGTFNNSNQALFRYDRNIGSVSLWVRY